jgi:beta-mannosidase
MRDAYADRLLTLRPRSGAELAPGGPDPVEPGAVFTPDGAPALIAVNDGPAGWTVEATVTRRNLAGDVLASAALSIPVAAGAAVTVPLPPDLTTPGDPSAELIVADAGESRTIWFFARDKDIPWPAAAFTATVEADGPSTKVTVTAGTILRSLTLYPDRLDPAAEADRADVTLLPGESVTVTVHSGQPLDPAALTTRPVLRCVNDIAG